MSDLQSNFLDEYAKAIVETAREPFLVLAADLRVLIANNVFYLTFDVHPRRLRTTTFTNWEAVSGTFPGYGYCLKTILPRSTSFHDFEITYEFESIGLNTFLLNARRLHQEGSSREMYPYRHGEHH